MLNPGRMETARQELSAMHFEEAWAGSVLHDEFMEWQQRCTGGQPEPTSLLTCLSGGTEAPAWM